MCVCVCVCVCVCACVCVCVCVCVGGGGGGVVGLCLYKSFVCSSNTPLLNMFHRSKQTKKVQPCSSEKCSCWVCFVGVAVTASLTRALRDSKSPLFSACCSKQHSPKERTDTVMRQL